MKEKNFFVKHQIVPSSIVYLYRRAAKSIIRLLDGEEIETYRPLKNLKDDLPPGEFWAINKSVIVAASQVVKIDGLDYTLRDGTIFAGRVRNAGEHKRNQRAVELRESSDKRPWATSSVPIRAEEMLRQFRMFDDLPIPVVIIEVVFDRSGRGMDFLFRYCNKEVARIKNLTVESLLDQSFSDAFSHADPKWLLTYGDVAINGVSRAINAYSPTLEREITLYCFCPRVNYCAVILMEREEQK